MVVGTEPCGYSCIGIVEPDEGSVLFNDAPNTFSYGYMALDTW